MYIRLIATTLLPISIYAIELVDLNSSDNNSTIKTVIIESNLTIEETEENITTQIPITIPIIEESNTTLSSPVPILIEESNITQELNNTIIEEIESNSTKESNNTQTIDQLDIDEGNASKGEIIFKEKLEIDCNTTATEFAQKFSQEDWEDMGQDGTFKESIFKLCPKIKTYYDNNWTVDLYKFSYDNGNDCHDIPDLE